MRNTLTQTPIADVYAELNARFAEWCRATGTDPSDPGAWDAFGDQLPCD